MNLGLIREWILRYNWISLVISIMLTFLLLNPLFFKNTLVHEAPQGYLAGDAYWHLSYTSYLIDKGYYTEEPPFLTGYNPTRINTLEPPLFFYAAASISWALGIPAYDATIFLLLAAILGAICALYLVANKIHRLLPYFALPPVVLLAVFPFNAGISWGFWKFYLAGILLFVAIAIIILTERSVRQSILLGLLLCGTIISHITMALYLIIVVVFSYIYDYLTQKWPIRTALRELVYPAIIGIVGFGISIDYIFEFYAARIGGNSAVSSAVGQGYTLYGANPYVHHLGFIFWIALVGIVMAFLLMGSGDRQKRKAIIIFLLFFLLMLGPIVGYDRIYQFRLLWPLFIALSFGLAFLLPLKLVGDNLSPFLALAVFISLSAYLFISSAPATAGIGDQTYSLVEPAYWKAIEALSLQQGVKIFLIDPSMTQTAISYNLRQYTRYLYQQDVSTNNTLLGPSWNNCLFPSYIRTGFLSFQNNTLSSPYCQNNHVELCKFDYFLLHTAPSTQEQYDWLVNQITILQGMNLTVQLQEPQVLILKNPEVC